MKIMRLHIAQVIACSHISIRQTAKETATSSIQHILKENTLHPFKIRLPQTLLPFLQRGVHEMRILHLIL